METEDVYVNMDFYNKNENAKKHLLKLIQKNSLFIGSRAWQVSTENSDYDYLIRYQRLKEIFNFIEKKYLALWECKLMFTQSHGDSCDVDKLDEFYSIIITIDEEKYNVISPMDGVNFQAWVQSARQMIKFIGSPVIQEKRDRVSLFEWFKDHFRKKLTEKKRKELESEIGEQDFPF